MFSLQISPLNSVWDRPESMPWPKPFTETLRCALCASFSLATRSRLTTLFSKKLSRMIPTTDISFIEFADRKDKMSTLAKSYQVNLWILKQFRFIVIYSSCFSFFFFLNEIQCFKCSKFLVIYLHWYNKPN